MFLKKWDELPTEMQNEKVRRYYNILRKKRIQLIVKRIFDIFVSIIILVLLSPLFLLLSVIIKLDSKGTVFFRQIRVTQYGKKFKIFKFRTMIQNAEAVNTQVTSQNDLRITKVGRFLREYRLDEIPQLLNIIFTGDMSLVGTRPEVPKYVAVYTDEMKATLLLPAGVTSEASIKYKDEEKLLNNANNADYIYINEILPKKMTCNLTCIKNFNFLNEVKIIILTVIKIYRKRNDWTENI